MKAFLLLLLPFCLGIPLPLVSSGRELQFLSGFSSSLEDNLNVNNANHQQQRLSPNPISPPSPPPEDTESPWKWKASDPAAETVRETASVPTGLGLGPGTGTGEPEPEPETETEPGANSSKTISTSPPQSSSTSYQTQQDDTGPWHQSQSQNGNPKEKEQENASHEHGKFLLAPHMNQNQPTPSSTTKLSPHAQTSSGPGSRLGSNSSNPNIRKTYLRQLRYADNSGPGSAAASLSDLAGSGPGRTSLLDCCAACSNCVIIMVGALVLVPVSMVVVWVGEMVYSYIMARRRLRKGGELVI